VGQQTAHWSLLTGTVAVSVVWRGRRGSCGRVGGHNGDGLVEVDREVGARVLGGDCRSGENSGNEERRDDGEEPGGHYAATVRSCLRVLMLTTDLGRLVLPFCVLVQLRRVDRTVGKEEWPGPDIYTMFVPR
jgi:hypothetical protein